MGEIARWSVDLGRWSGARFRIHILFPLFALGGVLNATLFDFKGKVELGTTCVWLGMLLVVVMLRELAEVWASKRFDVEVDDVLLWPLGNLAIPLVPSVSEARSRLFVALSGLAANLALALASALVLASRGLRMEFNPVGNDRGGAPALMTGEFPAAYGLDWCLGWFGFLNWIVFLLNLVPALPLSGGRIVRALLAERLMLSGVDESPVPKIARAAAIALGLVGVCRVLLDGADGFLLICLAIFVEMWVRAERLAGDADSPFARSGGLGFGDEEMSWAAERPKTENGLTRWRRAQAESKRKRREAREAADRERLDEILEKLHLNGNDALTSEERGFLDAMSRKMRRRTRGGD